MEYASVIITHFSQKDPTIIDDRGKSFKKCLESLQKTDYPIEVIVIDNGGNPDDSDYLLEETRNGHITHYIRNHTNLHFSYGWNMGARIATGDYLVFTCNDILFKPNWLNECVKLLDKYKDRKLIATPYISPDKLRPAYQRGETEDARFNSMAGSNCIILKPEAFKEIGEFPNHRIGGTFWHRRMVKMGYEVVVPKVDLVSHLHYRDGVVWLNPFNFEKSILNGKVDFNYKFKKPNYYFGSQKSFI